MSSAEATPNSYLIKRIRFFSREVPVFLQNLNGPCPLLALANVLSLRNELRLPAPHARDVLQVSNAPSALCCTAAFHENCLRAAWHAQHSCLTMQHTKCVVHKHHTDQHTCSLPCRHIACTQDQLVSLVAERLLEASTAFEGSAPDLASDMRQNVSDSFEALSKLTTGVDVNVRFTAIGAFEPTNEVAVFDLLGINLVHGWLVNPSDTAQAAVFGSKSYNELVEMLFLTLGDEEAGRLSSMRSLPGIAGSAPRHSHGAGSFSSTSTGAATAAAAAIAAAAASEGADASDAATSEGPRDASEAAGTAAAAEASTPPAPVPTTSTQEGSEPAASSPEQQAQEMGTFTGAQPASEATAASEAAVATQPSTAQPAAGTALEEGVATADAAHQVIEGLSHDMVTCLARDAAPAASPLGESPTHRPTPDTHGVPECVGQPQASPAGTAAAAAAMSVPHAGSNAAVADGMLTPARSSASGGDLAQAHVVRDFLERHCSQLTDYGLYALRDGLKENQLGVFFRNNHFNTVFKHGDDLYLLVTDQVWGIGTITVCSLHLGIIINEDALRSYPNTHTAKPANHVTC